MDRIHRLLYFYTDFIQSNNVLGSSRFHNSRYSLRCFVLLMLRFFSCFFNFSYWFFLLPLVLFMWLCLLGCLPSIPLQQQLHLIFRLGMWFFLYFMFLYFVFLWFVLFCRFVFFVLLFMFLFVFLCVLVFMFVLVIVIFASFLSNSSTFDCSARAFGIFWVCGLGFVYWGLHILLNVLHGRFGADHSFHILLVIVFFWLVGLVLFGFVVILVLFGLVLLDARFGHWVSWFFVTWFACNRSFGFWLWNFLVLRLFIGRR